MKNHAQELYDSITTLENGLSMAIDLFHLDYSRRCALEELPSNPKVWELVFDIQTKMDGVRSYLFEALMSAEKIKSKDITNG